MKYTRDNEIADNDGRTFRLPSETEIQVGIAVNRLRKLQKNWDYWYSRRQQDPLRGRNAEQEMAEQECARLAPLIQATKAIINRE